MTKKNNIPETVSEKSMSTYMSAVHAYEKFHNMKIEELLNEALQEQEDKVPNHKLKVYDRILNFRNYNIKRLVGRSVTTYESIIKQCYSNARVIIPPLPRINHKLLLKNPPIEFEDFLTKYEIKKAISLLSLPIQARIMVMVEGGLSNEECETLTLQQFLDDLYPYHQETDPRKALSYLANKNHCHLWCTKLTRVKTGKPYYAVVSPEVVQKIALAKLKEKKLKPKLLTNNKHYFRKKLSDINDNYGYGYAGGHRRLRPHMLRKFHATYISSSVLDYGEESALRNYEVDELQGRGTTQVQDAYIKTTKVRQKLLYAKIINNVSLFNEYDYDFVDGDVKVWVRDSKVQLKKVVDENRRLKSTVKNQASVSEELKNYIEVVGYDKFKNGLAELLSQF